MYNSIIQHTIISLDDLRGLCPADVAAIESHSRFPGWGRIFEYLDEKDGFDLLFYRPEEDLFNEDEWPKLNEVFTELWFELEAAFDKATQGGSLGITYFDIARCDRNDCIPTNEDGCVFTVEGTHEKVLTAAGRILAGKLESMLITQYE